eukprot:scaffold12155_cov53-Phaeocystis_antarctica.AAC.2
MVSQGHWPLSPSGVRGELPFQYSPDSPVRRARRAARAPPAARHRMCMHAARRRRRALRVRPHSALSATPTTSALWSLTTQPSRHAITATRVLTSGPGGASRPSGSWRGPCSSSSSSSSCRRCYRPPAPAVTFYVEGEASAKGAEGAKGAKGESGAKGAEGEAGTSSAEACAGWAVGEAARVGRCRVRGPQGGQPSDHAHTI